MIKYDMEAVQQRDAEGATRLGTASALVSFRKGISILPLPGLSVSVHKESIAQSTTSSQVVCVCVC